MRKGIAMDSSKTSLAVIRWLERNQSQFNEIADQIWLTPEMAWREFRSSRLQADFLEGEGFSIT
jgi:metal-dependent amidase/aminoacylase/carboxypeptidase family protein